MYCSGYLLATTQCYYERDETTSLISECDQVLVASLCPPIVPIHLSRGYNYLLLLYARLRCCFCSPSP